MVRLRSSVQHAAQQHARAVQLGLGRSRGDAEEPRDLLVPVAFDVVQHEHHPRPLRQARNPLLEIHAVLAPARARLDPLQHFVVSQEPGALGRERGPLAEDEVHRQAVEPCGEARLAAERVQLLPRAHEHVLGQLRGAVEAHHPAGQRVHPVHVLLVQAAKGLRVSTRGQRCVTGLKALGQGALVQGQGRLPGQGCGHCPGLDQGGASKVETLRSRTASGESPARAGHRPARGLPRCNPTGPRAVYISVTPGPAGRPHPFPTGDPMTLRHLSALAALALLPALPSPGLAARTYALSGDDVAIWNPAGQVRLEAATGSSVEVVVSLQGRDANEVRVSDEPLDGRPTLRVLYPWSRPIVYPPMGRWSNSGTTIRKDGTWGGSFSGLGFLLGNRATVRGGGSGTE